MLGPYEVISLLGAGGMGEVYRARDTRLDRVVAVKVLRSGIGDNGDLRMRFEREARAISHLSHPHICALYDVGNHNGSEYLVMEYVAGETLAERIQRGPLAVSQVLRYGTQIAEALHHAHRGGITHRDLKPGNVMLTTAGAKLLDFGLAKFAERLQHSSDDSAPETLKHFTAEGAIVGTFQYMSPEQIQGNAVDPRSDIFSLGVVLYEMTSGQRPFPATSSTALIAAILTADPVPLRSLQPATPPALERIVQTALEKNPDERWQTAQDVGRQLRWLAESSPALEPSEIPTSRARRSRAVALIAISAVAAALLTWGATKYFARPIVHSRPARLLFVPPESMIAYPSSESPNFALSPDGRTLCFVGFQGPTPALFLRTLDSLAIRKLERTDGASAPFWSPDGASIGYSAGGKLWKTAADGTAIPEAICNIGLMSVNASWSGNMILFSDRQPNHGIFRVAATGGTPEKVTTLTPAEGRHGWPHVLADGRHFLYLRHMANSLDTELVLASTDSPKTSVLLRNVSQAERLSDDRIAYVREGKLLAQRFDVDRGMVVGEPSVIADDVSYFLFSARAQFATANGVVVYRTETPTGRLTLVDRRNAAPRLVDEGVFNDVALSFDGKRATVALISRATGMTDIWIYDLARGTKDRITSERGMENVALWTPDGRSIIYSSGQGGSFPYVVRRDLASGTVEDLLPPSTPFQIARSITRDGAMLFYSRRPADNHDILRFDMKTMVSTPVVSTKFNEGDPQVSPDGKWLAFGSDMSGTWQVYLLNLTVRSVERIRISKDGGENPRWRGDGEELFYRSYAGVVMSVVPTASGDWSEVRSTELFRLSKDTADFAVTPDGQSFLIAEYTPGEFDTAFTIVLGGEFGGRP